MPAINQYINVTSNLQKAQHLSKQNSAEEPSFAGESQQSC